MRDHDFQKVIRDNRMTLPGEFRERTGVQPGDNVAVTVTEDHTLEVKAIEEVVFSGEGSNTNS